MWLSQSELRTGMIRFISLDGNRKMYSMVFPFVVTLVLSMWSYRGEAPGLRTLFWWFSTLTWQVGMSRRRGWNNLIFALSHIFSWSNQPHLHLATKYWTQVFYSLCSLFPVISIVFWCYTSQYIMALLLRCQPCCAFMAETQLKKRFSTQCHYPG